MHNEELSNEAVAVRLGYSHLDDLVISSRRANAKGYGHALSVYSANPVANESEFDFISRILSRMPTSDQYRVLRKTTVGRLRASGFEPIQSGPDKNHFTVDLGEGSKDDHQRFSSCLDEPGDNPLYSERKTP